MASLGQVGAFRGRWNWGAACRSEEIISFTSESPRARELIRSHRAGRPIAHHARLARAVRESRICITQNSSKVETPQAASGVQTPSRPDLDPHGYKCRSHLGDGRRADARSPYSGRVARELNSLDAWRLRRGEQDAAPHQTMSATPH